MLLLLIPPEDNLNIKLDNLFHISTGILEDKHERFIEIDQQKQKVWFLHMGDMISTENIIDFENLSKNEIDLIKNRERREQKKNKSKLDKKDEIKAALIPIDEKKLIQSTDYLLCARGIPAGYSMIDSIKESKKYENFKENFYAAATHHFIVFKLRDTYEYMNIPYLHIMLDILVKTKLLEIYKLKKANGDKDSIGSNDKNTPAVIITSIKEIKDIQITIPFSPDQVKTYERQEKFLQTHFKMLLQAKRQEEELNNYLNAIANPNSAN